MILREAIQLIDGFRFVAERLALSSAPGRRQLLETPWLTSRDQIETRYDRVESLCRILAQAEGEARCGLLDCKLMQVKDIRATVKRTAESCVLDDLELFELKNFALLADEIRQIAQGWEVVGIPDLQEVIRLLDPEGTRIPQFYVYDVYSEELAAIRRKIKAKKQHDPGEAEQAYARSLEIEDRIREELSVKLRAFHDPLDEALKQVAELDVLLAKARQVGAMNLVRPLICDGEHVTFNGLFNPEIAAELDAKGRKFQAVDLRLEFGATVVTGANMAGKTVLLKSVALAQCLMQFGFYVPAAQASMVLVDEIRMSVGDAQDTLRGLSSYAAEMLRIDEIIARIKAGRRVLALIDEPARTTNPAEGRALVNSVVELLTTTRTIALVTTHYSGITAPCRRLRVKGFVENASAEPVTLKNIDRFIDYSLLEETGQKAPREAVRVARILGVDPELLDRAETYLQNNEETI